MQIVHPDNLNKMRYKKKFEFDIHPFVDPLKEGMEDQFINYGKKYFPDIDIEFEVNTELLFITIICPTMDILIDTAFEIGFMLRDYIISDEQMYHYKRNFGKDESTNYQVVE
jgi:hypothetical protein